MARLLVVRLLFRTYYEEFQTNISANAFHHLAEETLRHDANEAANP